MAWSNNEFKLFRRLQIASVLVQTSQHVRSEDTIHSSAKQAKIDAAWGKADTVPGMDPDTHRQDKVGNVIIYDSYGQQTARGWDLHHSKPKAAGGTDHPTTCRPCSSARTASTRTTATRTTTSRRSLRA